MELKMNLVEYNKWKFNNKYDDLDSYGGCVFRYAEKWAEMMEKEIDEYDTDLTIYNKLLYCAEQYSFDCDEEGVTGFQHHMARQILVKCWKYGELLNQAMKVKDWKNRYDIRQEIKKEKHEEKIGEPKEGES